MYSIDHLNRHVSDVDKSIAFYCEALGYRLLKRGVKASGMPYAILMGSAHELFICEKEGFLPETENNFRHIGYAVPDADALLAELKRKGIAGSEAEIVVKPWSRQFYLKDPDGFDIDFIQWTDKQGFYDSNRHEAEQ